MECEHAHDASELRQGDIFAAHPGTENWQDPWRRFGVIISADCDLAQRKTGPNLVFVPIVGLPTYVKDVWLPAQIESLDESCRQKLEKALVQAQGKPIAARHAMSWSESELVNHFDKSGGADKDALARAIELRALILQLHQFSSEKKDNNVDTIRAALSQYFDMHEKVERVQKPGAVYRRGIIVGALDGLAQKDRADTWPLIDIIGLDPEMREDEKFGFVSDMRRFSVMPAENIVLNRISWVKDPNLYLRVCRLGPYYKMDFLQKFAALFTRIGLDDKRGEEQKALFGTVSAKLIPGE
ncbi:MAG TPA: hypothetical protein VFF81_06990 [Noviherbaspirillum sp.]|nr:hypothetical protein [Noviherbaspirillum sp.]